MLNVSDRFKQALSNDKRDFEIEAEITLSDGTELTVTNAELWSQGFEVESAVSSDSSFDIGDLIIGRMRLVLNNIYEDYTQYDFYDASVNVTLRLNYDDGELIGRNLLLNTEDERVSAAASNNSAYTSYYNASAFGKDYFHTEGYDLTISADYEVVGEVTDNSHLYVQLNGTAIVPIEGQRVQQYVADEPIGTYIRTFRLTANQASQTVSRLRFRLYGTGVSDGATLKISNVKLEIGRTATDYSRAPEDDGTVGSLRFDNYTVDSASDNASQIVLSCLDNAKQFERQYSESNLTYPASVNTIIRDACTVCGVPLLTNAVSGGDYIVQARPISDDLTFLKVVSWCAQITGNFARINNLGQLVIGWYDVITYESTELTGGTENGTEWTIADETADDYHHVASWGSLSTGTDDVTITGVRVVATASDNAQFDALCGTEGYVLEVTNNELIGVSDVQAIANQIGAKIVGMNFRAYRGACLGSPTIEAGDLIWFTDRKGRNYRSFVCGTTFKVGQYQNLYCGAATPSKQSSTGFNETTRAIVKTRQALQKSLTTYEDRVASMAELIARGFGMYYTAVRQQDGSIIPYIHDKPTIEQSSYVAYMTSQGIMMESDGTTTAAVDKNGNALLNTLTARGINADWINSGAISIHDTQGNETFYANCLTGEVRINASSFSLTGSTIQQITQTAVDGIEVGGRNLIRNTRTYEDWYVNKPQYITYPSDNVVCLSASGLTALTYTRLEGLITLDTDTLVNGGDKYILTFEVMSPDWSEVSEETTQYTGLGASCITFVTFDGDDPNTQQKYYLVRLNRSEFWASVPTADNDKWLKFVSKPIDFSTITWANSSREFGELMRVGPSLRTNGELYFKNFKLERGSKYTDWTPAPEDLQTGISNATNVANNANATANSANATAQQALDVASSAGGLVAYLDNDYQTVPTNADGTYTTFPECTSQITVFYNSSDVSAQCTYTTSATTGVTGTWDLSTRTYTVTGLSVDSGTVTISAAYNNASLSKKFTVTKVKQGLSGTNGRDGDDGRGVASVDEYYAISDSDSTAPQTWGTRFVRPTAENPYLWNFNRILYTDNTTEDSTPIILGNYAENGEDGQDGADGVNGADGRGISSIVEHYGLSSDAAVEPSEWSDTMLVTTTTNKYLWNYETISYTDSTTQDTTKRIIGTHGATGTAAYNYQLLVSDLAIVKDADGVLNPSSITMTAKRNQGTKAPANYAGRFKVEVTTDGSTWTTAYTSSANEATHAFTPADGVKNIRISLYLAGGTTTLLDSQTIPIVSDGENGADGFSPAISASKVSGVTTVTITDKNGSRSVAINDGTNGASIATVTNYYLVSASSTGVTTSTSGWKTDPTQAVMTSSKPYLWNYEVSKDDSGRTVATTSPAIIGHFGKNGTNGTNGTNGRGITSITEYYAVSATQLAPDDEAFSIDVIPPTQDYPYLWNYEVISYTDGTSETTSKHVTGICGQDSYSVVLTNESHTFAGGTSAAVASSTTCGIVAYKGGQVVPATIKTITGHVTGLTTNIQGNGTESPSVIISVTTSMTTKSGTLTIPVEVEGQTFNKTFSWGLSLNGKNAYNYELLSSANAIIRNKDGGISPTSITFSAKRGSGTSTPTNYSGRLKVESTTDGSTWTELYVSNANESSKTVSVPTNLSVKAIRCTLYLAGGTATQLDIQAIPVIEDGKDGFSPTVTSSKSNGVTTVTITDKNGTRSVQINDGANGASIKTITNYYLASASSSGVTTTTAGWTTNPTGTNATMTASKPYLWNYEISKDSNDKTISTTSPSIIGRYALDGNGISSIAEYYAINASTTAPADSAFSTAVVAPTKAKPYLWNYEKITYTNGTTVNTSKHIVGVRGQDGVSPTLTSTKNNGVTTVTITDGTGTKTLTINDGAAGASVATITNYYLASASGSGISTTTTGWTTNPTASAATISADKQYLWNYEVCKDNNGNVISTTSPCIIGRYGQDGATGASGKNGKGISAITEYYALSTTTTAPADSAFATAIKTPTATNKYLWNYEKISYTDMSVVSTAKHIIGVYGDSGADSYTIVLSNENHTFAGDVSNALASSVDCSVIAYKGATQVPAKIGTISGTLSGKLTTTISNNETTTAKFTVTATTSLTQKSGVLTIPVTVDGKTFAKTFSWSVSFKGEQGATGTAARHYFLDVSPKSVKLGESLTFSPSTVDIKAYYRDGDTTTQNAYSGYIIVQACVNNSWSQVKTYTGSSATLTLKYTSASSASVSGNTISLPQTASALRVQLKSTSSSTVFLDQQEIIILVDISSLTQEIIFNKLTNNGEVQGLYLESGKIYLNAEYIKAKTLNSKLMFGGTLILGGESNGNGILQVQNASGVTKVTLNNEGVIAHAGKLGNWEIVNDTIRREMHDGKDVLLQAPTSTSTAGSTVLAIGAPASNNQTSWGDAPFKVTTAGAMYSTKGYIGGWEITSNAIQKAVKGGTQNALIGSGTKYPISVGATWKSSDSSTNWGGAVFRVRNDGYMVAKNASIYGSLESVNEIGDTVLIKNGFIYGRMNGVQTGLIDMTADYGDGGGGYSNISIKGNYGLRLQAGNIITFQVPASGQQTVINSRGLTSPTLHAGNGYTGWLCFPIVMVSDGTVYEYIRLYVEDGIIKR